LAPENKDVVDIGCGGGIYSLGFISLGARTVTGVDSSAQYLEEARLASLTETKLTFALGSAIASGLPDACADIVFQRAVIHHLSERDQLAGAVELRRLLRPDGYCVVQDRTLEDVESADPTFWIRATLFEEFPQLLEFEGARRPTAQTYANVLRESGFIDIRVITYSETRKYYLSFRELEMEIMARKGKSILFELSDSELRRYCDRLKSKAMNSSLRDVDPWTIWLAAK
jgi:2-polyprenyl-3-methyl-5-hydroxy-6-metoxy-1,4-benzoquinol methylase